jgi:hypothetical protein
MKTLFRLTETKTANIKEKCYLDKNNYRSYIIIYCQLLNVQITFVHMS